MFDNPEMMLGFGWAIGIVAGINIARFCWPDEGVWLGELKQRERELRVKIRQLEKQEKELNEDIQRKKNKIS